MWVYQCAWAVMVALLGACALDRSGLRAPADVGPPRDAGPPDSVSPRDAGPPDSGPDPVDAGPCPGDGDDDGDGVCNSDDACPGADDADDADGDAVPDGCDPCSVDGPEADPIALPVSDSGITIDGVRLNGGGNVVVVDPEDPVRIELTYQINVSDCTPRRYQIEVGFLPGDGPIDCAYDAETDCSPAMDTHTMEVPAPDTPGEYFLRFGKGQDEGCLSTGGGWWEGREPPMGRTFGAVCVR